MKAGSDPDRRSPIASAWHARDADDVLVELDSDAKAGLRADEAARRLEEHGRNRLPEEEREGALRRLLRQFHNVLIYILIAAAIFTAFLGEWIDTAVIAAVVLVNALIGFVQEGKAEAALEAIRRVRPNVCSTCAAAHALKMMTSSLIQPRGANASMRLRPMATACWRSR